MENQKEDTVESGINKKIAVIAGGVAASLVGYLFYGFIDLQRDHTEFKAAQSHHNEQVEGELKNIWANYNEGLKKDYEDQNEFMQHKLDEKDVWIEFYKSKSK